ncbi:MAG: DUF4296 domain-containing protein [Bacteroidales bacterium]|nr:DUF4296 domain-containing protein [Bacteroidales bacterium]
MKKIATIFLCCFLVSVTACTQKGIIPKKKMAAINADFYLMDQYLGADLTMRKFSDTTAVYKPVLRYYGYTADEYFTSVDYYLENSRDMAKILDMTEAILRKRQKAIMKRIEADSHRVDTTTTNFF